MKNPRSLRLVLTCGLLGSTLLASAAFALTPAQIDALRTKADRGNAIAQYTLGLAYADRRETIYDPAQAYAWLSVAANNGANGKALSTLISLLTPEQLADGKRRLAALTASPIAPAASPISATSETPAAPASVTEVDPDQKKLSAELAAAWKENELLKSGLTAQLADANKRVAIAEAALASKDKQIATLQTRLTEASAAPVAAAAPIGVSAELASLRSERDQLQAAANSAATELATLRASAARTAAEQSVLREKLARSATDVAIAQRAQSLAESEAASLKAAADRAGAERLAVAAQLEAVTTELATVKEAAGKAPATTPAAEPDPRIAGLESERDALARLLHAARAKLSAAELVEAEKNASIAAMSGKDQDLIREKQKVDELARHLSDVQQQLDTSKNTQRSLADTVKTLTEERDALTAQLAAAKAAVPVAPAPEVVTAPIPAAPTPPAAPDPEAAARLAALETAKAETETKLAAALRSFTLQQAEIDRLQRALASIDNERAATATKLETALAELTSIRPQAATAASVSAEAESLRTQLAAANQKLVEQSNALAASSQSLNAARKTVDAATADLVTTRDQLRQTQAQAAVTANENQQLKTRLALAGSLPAGNNPSRPGSIPSISINLPSAPAAPVTPPPAAVVAETPAAPRIHTVASGDSLSRISKQYYGTAARWNDILQANKGVITNPNSLSLGTKLRIP